MTLTPAPARPFSPGMAQPAQHHRKRREPEVGLGLAAAGREEQQVDRRAVRIARVGEAREVQQDEGELERAPARRLDAETLAERPGHRAVRHAERIERVRILRQHRDAALDPVGGNACEAQRVPPPCRADFPAGSRRSIAASRSTRDTGRRAAEAPSRRRRHRRAPRVPPSTARRPARPRSPSFPPRRSGSSACGAAGTRRPAISHSAETPWPVAYSGVSA